MLKAYTCVWSNKSAAEMVKFYRSVFKGTKVGKFSYWGKNPMGVQEGSVLTAHITILGQKLMLLNGYVDMPFNESISFVVPCKTQREIDHYWKKLTAGGGKPVQCGWLIDKFGVRWQIAPADFDKWNTTKNKAKKEAMTLEMWKMKKLDIKKLKAAFDKMGDTKMLEHQMRWSRVDGLYCIQPETGRKHVAAIGSSCVEALQCRRTPRVSRMWRIPSFHSSFTGVIQKTF